MVYYLIVGGLVLHAFFWGWGLAALVVPRIWRQWTWVFAPSFGLALQSAVVWMGAHTPLHGTSTYAWWSELLPLVLLSVAWSRRERISVRSFSLLPVLLAVAWMLVSPMSKPGLGLTASSLGSCDHADYAAGARVFHEFASTDRAGFMGLPEVTKVRSTDYFFDFWMQLNHFTPSALLAHNAAVFGVEPYRLVSVTGVALVLSSLPLVLFLFRVACNLRSGWLITLLAVYGFSPINAYAVHQGALGQLYAIHGITLLTVVVFGAAQAANVGRQVWTFGPAAFLGFWLLAGSYNFILLVCLAPAGAWLVAQAALRRRATALVRVSAMLLGALAVCAFLFWGRFAGLIERFSLFEEYNFGWEVPLFSPEGWLGMLKDSYLNGWAPWSRILLSIGVVSAFFWGLARLWSGRKLRAASALALTLPVIVVWSVLAWESRVRGNASYDAYKILAVFYPGVLGALCCWASVAHFASRGVKCFFATLLAVILLGNIWAAEDFRQRMGRPPLRLDRAVVNLGALEQDSQIASLNMLIENYWDRLWANSFLLRKPQFFATHTYEGRLNTALKGEWDLTDNPLRAVPLDPQDYRSLDNRFHLVRVGSAGLLHVKYDEGWYPQERAGLAQWRWSAQKGLVSLFNPSGKRMRARLTLRLLSFDFREVKVHLRQEIVGIYRLNGSAQTLEVGEIILPPGSSTLTLSSDFPGTSPGPNDARKLGFALVSLELKALALEP